jgi:hypothetical protein
MRVCGIYLLSNTGVPQYWLQGRWHENSAGELGIWFENGFSVLAK